MCSSVLFKQAEKIFISLFNIDYSVIIYWPSYCTKPVCLSLFQTRTSIWMKLNESENQISLIHEWLIQTNFMKWNWFIGKSDSKEHYFTKKMNRFGQIFRFSVIMTFEVKLNFSLFIILLHDVRRLEIFTCECVF